MLATFLKPPDFTNRVTGRFFLAGVNVAVTTVLAFLALPAFLPACEIGGSTVIVVFCLAAAAAAAGAGSVDPGSGRRGRAGDGRQEGHGQGSERSDSARTARAERGHRGTLSFDGR